MIRSIAYVVCVSGIALAAAPVHAQTKALKELGLDILRRLAEKELGLAPEQPQGGGGSIPPQQFQQFGYQPTYEILLQFQSGGVPHEGVLVMQGNTGFFRVRTLGGVFDQNIIAQPYGNAVLLVGSNPRIAGSGIPAGNMYRADTLRVIRGANGQWAFADVCSQGYCSPVQVMGGQVR